MNGDYFDFFRKAFEGCMVFSKEIMSKLDDESYAKAVIELYGEDASTEIFSVMIKLIAEASDLPTERKIQLLKEASAQLNELLDTDVERKKKCASIINEGNRTKGDIAVKIVTGLLTGGVSLLPDAFDALFSA